MQNILLSSDDGLLKTERVEWEQVVEADFVKRPQ